MYSTFFSLFTRTKFIRIYGAVTQQSSVTKCQKCRCVYGDWSTFMENCTLDVTFAPIRNPYTYVCSSAYFHQNEKAYLHQ